MKYYVGVGRFKVVQFNPTLEWLNAHGMKVKTVPVYTGEDRGIPTCRIVVCLQNLEYDFVTFATFNLRKDILRSKAGKTCYLNSVGQVSWAVSEEELLASFVGKAQEYFEAYDGEPMFYDFLRMWLHKSEDQLLFKRDKWFKGDYNELNNRINDMDASIVGGSAVIEMTAQKLKNKIYTKKFIPEEEVDNFENTVFGEPYLKKLREQDRLNKDKTLTAAHKKRFQEWKKLLLSMNDMFYPCPDFYYNGKIKPYVGAENLVMTDDLILK